MGGRSLDSKPTAVKKRVPCEDNFLLPFLHVPADAVLCMARRVEAFDGNVAQLETLAILWGCRDRLAVFAAVNLQVWHPELILLKGGSCVRAS